MQESLKKLFFKLTQLSDFLWRRLWRVQFSLMGYEVSATRTIGMCTCKVCSNNAGFTRKGGKKIFFFPTMLGDGSPEKCLKVIHLEERVCVEKNCQIPVGVIFNKMLLILQTFIVPSLWCSCTVCTCVPVF